MADETQPGVVVSAPDDFSFQGALDYFQGQGSREAEAMLRQPLQYLKAQQVHKLRILPGTPKAVAWFASCRRHFMGRPIVAPLRRAGARKSVICPASFSEQPCFVDQVGQYLEAVGSNAIANELVLSDVAVVYAYRANEAEPQVAPYLITKSNINQLMDHWRDGYIFFHPVQGMAVTFKPIEGTNLFSVTPEPKISAVLPKLLEQSKPLSEVMNSLLIPYETMKTWFVQPIVEAVDHFLQTGEARPIDWKALTQTAPSDQQIDPNALPIPPPFTPPPAPPVQQPQTGQVVTDQGTPFDGGSFVSQLQKSIESV
jgi:hypothetical protein